MIDLSLGIININNFLNEQNLINKFDYTCNEYSSILGNENLLKLIKKKYKLNDESTVLITSGASQAITLLFTYYKDKKFLIPNPGYPQYKSMCNLFEIKFDTYDVVSNCKTNLNSILNEISKSNPDILVINTPHNPLGRILTLKDFKLIIKECRQKNILIIFDAVYNEFSYEKIDFLSLGYNKVFYINSFSKQFGLPAFRIGYVIGPNNVIEDISKINWQTTLQASNMLQEIVSKYYQTNINIKKWNEIIVKNRELINDYFKNHDVIYTNNQDGIFVVLKIPSNFYNAKIFSLILFKKFDIKVTPLEDFGGNFTKMYRLNLAVQTDKLRRALEKIEKFY